MQSRLGGQGHEGSYQFSPRQQPASSSRAPLEASLVSRGAAAPAGILSAKAARVHLWCQILENCNSPIYWENQKSFAKHGRLRPSRGDSLGRPRRFSSAPFGKFYHSPTLSLGLVLAPISQVVCSFVTQHPRSFPENYKS